MYLKSVTSSLSSLRSSETSNRPIKTPTVPPVRIKTGKMISHLSRSRGSLTRLVWSHEHDLAMRLASIMELQLLRIRTIAF
jgi:hypothetical protein